MSENTDVLCRDGKSLFRGESLILNYPQFDLIQTVITCRLFERGMAEQLAELRPSPVRVRTLILKTRLLRWNCPVSCSTGVPGIFQHEQRAYQ